MNIRKKYQNVLTSSGFSLIELLVVIAIGMVLIAALSLLVRSGLQASTGIQIKASAQEDSRLALQIMTAEIGMASYNPLFRTDPAFWVDIACAPINPAFRGIPEATANALTVTMATGGPDWVGDDPNEIIRYVYDAANERITRQTVQQPACGGAAMPFLGDTVASGRPREVRVVNAALGLPVFRYFNGQGVELVPGDIPNIRRVEITLAIESDQIDPSTGNRKRMMYSSSALVRNHVVK